MMEADCIVSPNTDDARHEYAGMMGRPDIPPGWNYYPSTGLQRLPIAALAMAARSMSSSPRANSCSTLDAAAAIRCGASLGRAMRWPARSRGPRGQTEGAILPANEHSIPLSCDLSIQGSIRT